MNNDLTECDKKQWESFRRLIDDENPIVRKALITEISRFPGKRETVFRRFNSQTPETSRPNMLIP